MPNYYNTGTVSVNNGATTVTGSSVLWSDLLAGDTLELAGQRVTIASVTDTTHFELANAWSGTTQSGAAYLVRFDAPSRFTSGYLAEQVRALVARAGILEAARPNYEVQSLGSNTPPASPVTNDMYVVGTSPTGAWAGQANNLAQWTGSAWLFTAADHGVSVVSAATGVLSVWNGTAWLAYVAPSAFMQTMMDDTSASAVLMTLGLSPRLAPTIDTPVTDLNTVAESGWTAADGSTGNRPGGAGNWVVLTLCRTTDIRVQIAFSRIGDDTYRRYHNGTSWSAWALLLTQASYAALDPFAIGSYVFARNTQSSAIPTGGTVFGSNLAFTKIKADGSLEIGSAIGVGTWMNMNRGKETTDANITGIYKRIG